MVAAVGGEGRWRNRLGLARPAGTGMPVRGNLVFAMSFAGGAAQVEDCPPCRGGPTPPGRDMDVAGAPQLDESHAAMDWLNAPQNGIEKRWPPDIWPPPSKIRRGWRCFEYDLGVGDRPVM